LNILQLVFGLTYSAFTFLLRPFKTISSQEWTSPHGRK
jgi:hypothetical protein